MSFVGGKLKLKGGEPLKAGGGVKKKKKKEASDAVVPAKTDETKDSGENDLKKTLEGYALPSPSEKEDRRTEAEKRFEERQRKLEEDRLKKLASKSHRDRVKDFNEYLGKLTVSYHGQCLQE